MENQIRVFVRRSVYIALISFFCMQQQALASSSGFGTITELVVNREGRVFFNTTGDRSARPACAPFARWVIDGSTPKGQASVAILISAHMSNKKVYINGTGGCEDWGEAESVASVQVAD